MMTNEKLPLSAEATTQSAMRRTAMGAEFPRKFARAGRGGPEDGDAGSDNDSCRAGDGDAGSGAGACARASVAITKAGMSHLVMAAI
jgi:hypothetical protein